MKTMKTRLVAILTFLVLLSSPALYASHYSAEIPAGTRFMVELRDKLEGKKVRPGKKFEARTLEALTADDGSIVPAGARLTGRVSSVERDKIMLRFERIDTGREKLPLVATVLGVSGEKDVKKKASEEGEIHSEGGRGKSTAIGAVVGAGVGAAVGATQAGKKGAAIGAGAGALGGGLIGAAAGGSKDLVLYEGTRVELQLDRPLVFQTWR